MVTWVCDLNKPRAGHHYKIGIVEYFSFEISTLNILHPNMRKHGKLKFGKVNQVSIKWKEKSKSVKMNSFLSFSESFYKIVATTENVSWAHFEFYGLKCALSGLR